MRMLNLEPEVILYALTSTSVNAATPVLCGASGADHTASVHTL